MDSMQLVAFRWEPLAIKVLWESYQNGGFPAYSRGMSEIDFIHALKDDMSQYTGFWMILSSTTPIAFGFSKYDGWAIEPHVEFFPGTPLRTIVVAYRLFFAEILKDVNIQVCLIRCYEGNKKMFDKFVKDGLMQFLRTVQYSSQTEYQYVIAKKLH